MDCTEGKKSRPWRKQKELHGGKKISCQDFRVTRNPWTAGEIRVPCPHEHYIVLRKYHHW